jgi:hypothetical protein
MIRIEARVMAVYAPRHYPTRRGHCVPEIGNILLHCIVIAQFDRTSAAQSSEHLRASELDHALAEVGIVRQVALRFGNERLAAEAGETVLDLGRVADLVGLTVADDIDADRDLTRDDVGNGLAAKRANFE